MSPKLKAAIIQNNTINSGILRHYLHILHPEIEVCGDADNIGQAVTLIEKHQPDIIFLDIELKDGLSFQIADIIRAKGIPLGKLIFLSATAHCEYALKAIDYACVDFILKPINENAVHRATEKAKKHYLQQLFLERALNQGPQNVSTLILPTEQNSKEVIEIAKISYCEAQKQQTIIHFSNDSSVTVFKNLGYFKQLFEEDSNFFQIHHALLINANYIKSFNHKSHEVLLMSGAVLEASRRYSIKFKAFWNEVDKYQFSF